MKVHINIGKEHAAPQTGIGQVVLAQYNLLPRLGIELVSSPGHADIVASHIEGSGSEHVDVLHCHGLYFKDVPHLPYSAWHRSVNARIAVSARRAVNITVPSDWVAEPFRRDMRIQPTVIGHGITTGAFHRSNSAKGYIYYNKNRDSDVCSSRWAYELATYGKHNQVVSTFIPRGKPMLPNIVTTGLVDHATVVSTLGGAGVYLATTLETFGIGIVEALASGVPVLGFNWGGIRDIVDHKVNGYLAEPENTQDLIEGLQYIRSHWKSMSDAAILKAREFDWRNIIPKYAQLYQDTLRIKQEESKSRCASIVITNYNYGKWVRDAINSALAQEMPCEVIVVDDGSTDNSKEVIESYGDKVRAIYQANQGVAAARNAGIAAASNEYVILLDADDRIETQFSRLLYEEMVKDRGIGITYTGLTLMDSSGLDYARSDWPPEFDWKIMGRFSVPPSNCIPSACMIRKRMWQRAGGIYQRFAPGEDAEFWARGLSIGFTAKRVTLEGLFHYRNHGDGASKKRKYVPTDDFMPFLKDGDFPFGVPTTSREIEVRSYLLPAVSVVIPVGPGHESIVEDAVLSVVGQTLREWEVLVVNDSGNDLSYLTDKFPFVKLHSTGGNFGAGKARNIGILNAKGPVVVFLDADDIIKPEALDHMMAAFVRSGGRYVYTDWYADRGAGLERHDTKPYNQMEWKMYHSVTVMMATDQAKDLLFDEDMAGWEDWEFFIHAAIKGYCGERLAEPLMVYRMDTGSRRLEMLENGTLSTKGSETLAVIRKRYSEFYTGEKNMAGCCGGNTALQIAKARMIDRSSAEKGAEPMKSTETLASASSTPLVIRLEYTGENIGEISYPANGRVYRGGNNPLHRYVDAPPEDAAVLERYGRWRRVAPVVPPPVIIKEVKKEPEPPIEIDEEAEAKVQAAIDEMLHPTNEVKEPEPVSPVVSKRKRRR